MKSNSMARFQAKLFALFVTACLLFQAGYVIPAQAATVHAVQAAFTTCADVTEIPQAECEALVALYNSTNGSGWTRNAGWLITDTPCSWYGIMCTAGHVTFLSMYQNGLTGNIPAQLGNLANLEYIVMDENQLTGSIPAELGNLINLNWLDLGYNQLTGNIPAELGSLIKIRFIYLANNQLAGSIPPELGNLINITELILGYNQLTGSIPPELGNLININYLGLYENLLTGSIPAELGNLTNITSLYLTNNQLTGSIPAQLGNMTSLFSLDLSGNQLSGSIPAELGSMTNLSGLRLGHNQLSGNIPIELGSLTNLTGISLSNNQLTGSIPAQLGNLTNLKWLDLSQNQLSSSFPTQLGNLSHLTWLSLDNNKLGGEIPVSITGLGSLTSLTLSCGLTSSNPAVIAFVGKLVPGWMDARCVTTITTDTPDPSAPDQTVNVTVTVGGGTVMPTGTVDISGADTNCQITLTGGAGSCDVVFNTLGAKALTAIYNGDSTYSGSWDSEAHSVFSCATVTEIPQTECEALVALYSGNNGANWTKHDHWLETNTPCTWYGVVCAAGRVSQLALAGDNLTGPMPTNLDSLPNLEYLNLSDNQLRGNLPAQLGSLANLTSLNLSHNLLTGSIPTQLGNLASLIELDLGDNQLSGSIPAELSGLANLAVLYLYNNQLTSLPAELGSLPNLSWLAVFSNQLTHLPPEVGNLPQLTRLDASSNQLTSIPPELGNLANLQELNLSQNQLAGSIPAQLGNLKNLTYLNLADNQLTGSLPSYLGKPAKLNVLYLGNNKLGGEIPLAITSLGAPDLLLSLSCGLTSTNPVVIAFLDSKLPGWQNARCVTTITTDTPDPSLVGKPVKVTVTVGGGATIPTGTVTIRGANTNCQVTLSGGTGSCNVIFNTPGAKMLTAVYNGDSTYSGSWDNEYHSSGMQRAKNGGFELYPTTAPQIPTYWTALNFGTLDGKNSLFKQTGKYSIKVTGATGKTKTLTQTLALSGAKGNAFVFSYWVKGAAIPKTAGVCQGQVILYYNATVKLTKTVPCPTGTFAAFQKKSASFIAPAAYNRVVIKFTYSKATGSVWLDGVSLLK